MFFWDGMETGCTVYFSDWCPVLRAAPTMLPLYVHRRDDKVGEFKLFHVPRSGLFFISAPRGHSAEGGLYEKRVASRHKDISYLGFFSPSLIFQRNSGDFTVTFRDSPVSHSSCGRECARFRPARLFSPLHPRLREYPGRYRVMW